MKFLIILLTCTACACSCALAQNSWKRHTIDNSSQGADGVKLGDFNGDGLMDVVTALPRILSCDSACRIGIGG